MKYCDKILTALGLLILRVLDPLNKFLIQRTNVRILRVYICLIFLKLYAKLNNGNVENVIFEILDIFYVRG